MEFRKGMIICVENDSNCDTTFREILDYVKQYALHYREQVMSLMKSVLYNDVAEINVEIPVPYKKQKIHGIIKRIDENRFLLDVEVTDIPMVVISATDDDGNEIKFIKKHYESPEYGIVEIRINDRTIRGNYDGCKIEIDLGTVQDLGEYTSLVFKIANLIRKATSHRKFWIICYRKVRVLFKMNNNPISTIVI